MGKSALLLLFCLCLAYKCLTAVPYVKAGQTRAPGRAATGRRAGRRCPIKGKEAVEKIRQRAFKNPSDQNLKDFLCTLPTFHHPISGGTYYVLEGDILKTEAEVKGYVRDVTARQSPASDKSFLAGSELSVNLFDNERDFYKNIRERSLRYAVDRDSFPTEEEFVIVRQNLRLAADQWQNLCDSCQVKFIDVTDPKVVPRLPGPNLSFIVKCQPLSGLIALAFYPHDLAVNRFLYVDPVYFAPGYDKVGVFRHELGHILGYRHEQLADKSARLIPGCSASEERENEWELLTPRYDAKSVMHYFCRDRGSLKLEFSDGDKIGHEKLYGTSPRP